MCIVLKGWLTDCLGDNSISRKFSMCLLLRNFMRFVLAHFRIYIRDSYKLSRYSLHSRKRLRTRSLNSKNSFSASSTFTSKFSYVVANIKNKSRRSANEGSLCRPETSPVSICSVRCSFQTNTAPTLRWRSRKLSRSRSNGRYDSCKSVPPEKHVSSAGD